MQIYNLREDDFEDVVALGNRINGDNYLDIDTCGKIMRRGCKLGLNCSYVAYEEERGSKLVGFRLTCAPGNWDIDHWFSPNKWKVPQEKVCLFKSNMVAEEYRGQGLGPLLLKHSIATAKQQGAVAGATHIWMQSPGNSAYKYFTKAGGEVVFIHPDRWHNDFADFGYICTICGEDCHCDGAEMILYFDSAFPLT